MKSQQSTVNSRQRAVRRLLSTVDCRLSALLLVAACSSTPAPEVVTLPAPTAPPPTAAMVRPSVGAGSYRLQAQIQTGNRPQPRTRGTPQSNITLTAQPSAVPVAGAPITTFSATVTLPGYTRAPRGRTGQAGAWWPIGGDSLVVQFSQGASGHVQFRGAMSGGAMQGEIWYVSVSTGATFQMGTFTAAKQR